MIDIHCHILPGVDDGAEDKEQSLAMLDAAKRAGITKIVCTPHYYHSDFSQKAVDDAFDWFYDEAVDVGIEAVLGYEIHWKKLSANGIDDVADHVIGDSKYALVEFSFNHDIGQLEERTLWKLKGSGITPILAHPERYKSIQDDLSLAHALKDAGILFQMSSDAIDASMFSGRRKACKYLLKNGMYDYIASDAHCPEDYNDYLKAIKAAPSVVASQKDLFY